MDLLRITVSMLIGGVLMLSGAETGAQVVATPTATETETATRTQAQVGISPSMFEISLDEALATHAYRLHNLGSEHTRVTVRVANWTLDEAGELVLLPTAEDSLDRWLVVNPLQVELPGGATRAVRFSVRPTRALPDGEYRAVLVFEEQPIARPPAGSGTMNLTARFRITSAVYASTGWVSRTGTIERVSLDSDRLVVHAHADGTGHVRPLARYRIRSVGSAALLAEGELTRAPVLPGGRRPIATELPAGVRLAPGRYEVEITGHLGESPVALRQTLLVAGSR